MKFYLGNTDLQWFNYLSKISPEDVNFWQPGGKSNFKFLPQGAPFLFKLKKPYHAIGGVGFFTSQTFLPVNMAWEIFKERNGCETLNDFRRSILSYRNDKQDFNPIIGCLVLTSPIFFNPEDWIPVEQYMGKTGIVQGKGFDSNEYVGKELWSKIEHTMESYVNGLPMSSESSFVATESSWPGFGQTVLKKVRLGQGAFRVLVTDAYNRKCSISGEKTLPVLEAAHIKPYVEKGPHAINNGLLLRSDIHKLFDGGYITITKDYKVEISRAIKEEFENGREYYQYHGENLKFLPSNIIDRPGPNFIEWHNNIFKGDFKRQ